jgi:CHASE3 domain sensor protein
MNTRPGAVDHDVGDVVARQQRLQRAVAQDVVDDVLDQVLLLRDDIETFLIATSSATMSRISAPAALTSSAANWPRSMVLIRALKIVVLVAW